MYKIKSYITAFRLRTLPLALSSILMGNFMAAYQGAFILEVGVLAVVTTVLLQILSNVANDYGDAVSGADNEERVGPARMVSTGKISTSEMKNTVVIFAFLSLLSGIFLIRYGRFDSMGIKAWSIFLLGVGAIAAAIKYTVGKNPYGYKGMGDVFVFVFFGLTGVLGTYFLHTGKIDLWLLLPASSVGLLSTGVLNLNNLRDKENDAKTGKITLVVKKGIIWGKNYHAFLLLTAMILMVLYGAFKNTTYWQWLFIIAFPLIIKNLIFVKKNNEPQLIDNQLKILAMATFVMVVFSGVALLF